MINKFVPVFVKTIPRPLEEGKLYVSEEYGVASHLCACGCGVETVTPFNRRNGWIMTKEPGDLVTLSPSIGNFSGESPYHAHYFIVKNMVAWCSDPLPRKQVGVSKD